MTIVMKKAIFTEKDLEGNYSDNLGCPYHRVITPFLKPGTYLTIAGHYYYLDFHRKRVDFTLEMLKVGELLQKKLVKPGFSIDIPIPEEFLREEFKDVASVDHANSC